MKIRECLDSIFEGFKFVCLILLSAVVILLVLLEFLLSLLPLKETIKEAKSFVRECPECGRSELED